VSRSVCIEFEGSRYHVMSRGDWRGEAEEPHWLATEGLLSAFGKVCWGAAGAASGRHVSDRMVLLPER